LLRRLILFLPTDIRRFFSPHFILPAIYSFVFAVVAFILPTFESTVKGKHFCICSLTTIRFYTLISFDSLYHSRAPSHRQLKKPQSNSF
jgi:hypothetical protein